MQQRLPVADEATQPLVGGVEVTARSTAARARFGGIFVIGFFLGALVLSVFYSEFSSLTTLRPATLHSVDPKSELIQSGNNTIIRKHVEKTAYLKPGGEFLPATNGTVKKVTTATSKKNNITVTKPVTVTKDTKVDIKKPNDIKSTNATNVVTKKVDDVKKVDVVNKEIASDNKTIIKKPNTNTTLLKSSDVLQKPIITTNTPTNDSALKTGPVFESKNSTTKKSSRKSKRRLSIFR